MRTVLLGAAGRDFHDFLVLYRDDPHTEVVAFTATQIPYIDDRRVPPELTGPRYPDGIPVVPEEELERLIEERGVERVVFAYSDVSNEHVARLAARATAAGADFVLPGAKRTMLRAPRPVLSICAVRTGCGKSQVSRAVLGMLRERGVRTVAVRHPMPYGDLRAQRVQRFATRQDFVDQRCTVEEREEYEPYVEAGEVVFAGVDYAAILEAAAAEAELLLWDGGNNDLPFVRPDLHVVLLDPHRPGDAERYCPSGAQLRLADVVLIAKSRTASREAVEGERALARRLAPGATIVEIASRVALRDGEADLAGRRVVCVEDGPTTTHGGMRFGAATLLAREAGAEIVDPRPYLVGEIKRAVDGLRDPGLLVPALGYSERQLADLEATLRAVPAELVLVGTPIDLGALVTVDKPVLRVRYDLEELPGEPPLGRLLDAFLEGVGLPA